MSSRTLRCPSPSPLHTGTPGSALRLLVALALASAVASWPERLRNSLVCQDLHVTAVPNGHRVLETVAGSLVSMVLLKDGAEVNCFQPGENYEVELKSVDKPMMGVLWMLEPARGDFPLGEAPRNTKKNSVCDSNRMPHISHFCEDQLSREGCILGDNGMSLKVGYRAPSDETSIVTFRYSVVFQGHEFVENTKQAFERCTVATTSESPADTFDSLETTTEEQDPPCPTDDSSSQPEDQDNNLTSLDVENNLTFDSTAAVGQPAAECNDFEPKTDAVETQGNCGIERTGSNESRFYTDPNTNVDYICTISLPKDYARKIHCEPRCEKEGAPAICRVKNRKQRPRDFTCRPTGEYAELNFGNVYRRFDVEIETKCECYSLADVDLTCSSTTTAQPSRCRPATTTTALPPHISNRP